MFAHGQAAQFVAPVIERSQFVALTDQGQHFVVGEYGFGNHGTADNAGIAAMDAARTDDEHFFQLGHAHDALQISLGIAIKYGIDRHFALRAKHFQQTLADQAGDDGRIGQQFQRHAQIDQTIENGQCIVGVHRGPDLVPGHGSLNGQAGRRRIADFTDHDDIGIETHGRLDGDLKSFGAFFFGLGVGYRCLHRSHDGIFRWIFNGNDMFFAGFFANDGGKYPLQSRGFAAASGATDDDDAGGALFHQFQVVGLLTAESQRTQIEIIRRIVVEQAHDEYETAGFRAGGNTDAIDAFRQFVAIRNTCILAREWLESRVTNIGHGLINRGTQLIADFIGMLFDEFEIILYAVINLRFMAAIDTNMDIGSAQASGFPEQTFGHVLHFRKTRSAPTAHRLRFGFIHFGDDFHVHLEDTVRHFQTLQAADERIDRRIENMRLGHQQATIIEQTKFFAQRSVNGIFAAGSCQRHTKLAMLAT